MDNLRKMELLSWMDTQISLREELDKEQRCGDVATCYVPSEIQIHYGIRELAQATGEKLVCDYLGSSEFPYRYSLYYRGVQFLQITDKPLTIGRIENE